MGGSSSQPRTDPAMSLINAFSVEDLYTPEFSESLQENTGYWQEPNHHEYPVEQVATSLTKKKKPTRNSQKRTIQSDNAPRQTAWTTEEEIMVAKGWRAVSENSKYGNTKKQDGFWCEVLEYIDSKTKQYDSGARDKDFVQRAMIHNAIETGHPFKLRHSWEILKDSPKWQEIALSKFATESGGGSKRHKSSGSSSFNTESGDASINLNTTVGDNDEDEVQEIQRPGGRDKARAAGKIKAQEKEECLAFTEIKRREVKCRERDVAAQDYRAQQEDIRFYLQPYDHLIGDQRMAMDEARAKLMAKYNLQY
ncbi:ALP1-like protein [Tanacetum coccineum]